MIPCHRFGHEAMATSFEVLIAESEADATYAAQAAEAVFAEIDRLEEELSRFRPMSEISRLNRLKMGQSLAVSLAAWDCLNLAKSVFEETRGAFDITIGPLMQLWRTPEGHLQEPPEERLQKARHSIGSHLFELEEETLSVRMLADHMVLDLGALGKGYALDQAVHLLYDWSITRAFLNAGDSTLLALDPPPDEAGWTVTLADGTLEQCLCQQALSGSGFWVQGAHIMNPRTLRPAPVRESRSYAIAPTAALSDALSTAFTIMTPEEITTFCKLHPEVQWLEA